MRDLSSVIDDLKKIADFTPQYTNGALPAAEQEFNELVTRYPQLNDFVAYLEFLRLTGGVHISNKIFSLGLYGFSGMVVPSFEEVSLIDLEHYFLFGEVLYYQSDTQSYFAFDLPSGKDHVYKAGDDDAAYRLCSSSFVDFLDRFARGDFPVVND